MSSFVRRASSSEQINSPPFIPSAVSPFAYCPPGVFPLLGSEIGNNASFGASGLGWRVFPDPFWYRAIGERGDSRKEMAREIIYAKEGTQSATKTIYKSSHAKFPLKSERSIRYD